MSDQPQGHNNDYHNQGGLLAFLFSFGVATLFIIYISFIHPGVDLGENLKDPTSALPTLAFDTSKVGEPWVQNAEMEKQGQQLYSQNCTTCHGAEGKGDGPAGAALNPKPRNLVEGPWKLGGGYIGIYKVLEEGIPNSGMVAFKHLKPSDRWAITQYVESITKAKVKEDPAAVATFAKTAK